MDVFSLMRNWFEFCFENPEKINPTHSALYFFCIEHCNRLGWKEKFGLPTEMTKEAIGVRNYKTYSKALNDLIDFGFIIMVQKSKNQYSSNIIALVKNTKAPTKALTKAVSKHTAKQVQSTVSIDIPNTILPNTEFKRARKSKITVLEKNKHFYAHQIYTHRWDELAQKYMYFAKALFKGVQNHPPFENVAKLPDQVSYTQFEGLYKKSRQLDTSLFNLLVNMENYKDIKKKTSVSLTLHSWMNRDEKNRK